MFLTSLIASFNPGNANARSASTDDFTLSTSSSYSAATASSLATISLVSSALTLSF
jgi:hypothetical protein